MGNATALSVARPAIRWPGAEGIIRHPSVQKPCDTLMHNSPQHEAARVGISVFASCLAPAFPPARKRALARDFAAGCHSAPALGRRETHRDLWPGHDVLTSRY